MKHGIYIHIPFCKKKCDYCGFYSVPLHGHDSSDGLLDRYAVRLIREFDERLARLALSADTVYFGGGTPSILAPEQIYGILRGLEARISLDPDTEITMEVNPEDATDEKLTGFRDAGVNRMVLGVQTLSGRIARTIGRSAGVPATETLDTFFGVPDVTHCADLITGVPTQSDDELDRDLAGVTSYRPSHISAYLLSIENGTPLGRRTALTPGFQAFQGRHYMRTRNFLRSAGYLHYEISNFSLPGFESRHNMKYWRYETYYGFGPGAHSFTGEERYYDAMAVEDYIVSETTRLERDARGPGAAMVEYLMTGLRLLAGVSIGEMEERFRYRLPSEIGERIGEAESRGHIVRDDSGTSSVIRLTERGLLLADTVIYRIVEPLVGA